MRLFRNYFKRSPVIEESTFATDSSQIDSDEADYNFDVVGESFRRDHLVQLIKKYDAAAIGVLYTDATLKLEPENPFDPTAVMVVVDSLHVGYVPKLISAQVSDHIKAMGGVSLKAPARIGWDSTSPQPLIGVRLKLDGF